MLTITLWHNPTCSKSQRALAHLQELGLDVQVREYLTFPPTREELTEVLAALGLQPSDLLRTKEPLFVELGLETATEEQALDALVSHPQLLERPVALRRDGGKLRAVVGRPAVRVLEVVAPSMGEAPNVAEAIARRVRT